MAAGDQSVGMTTTQSPPAGELATLVSGVRSAVEAHAGWSETAQLVAEQRQFRRHPPCAEGFGR